jgi:hypothetical protein
MTRRTLITVSLVLAVAAIGAALYRIRSKRTTTTTPTGVPQLSRAAPGATPLPAFFEARGLVSRLDGPVRLYASIAPEIPLSKQGPDGDIEPQRLKEIPLVIALENETYKTLDADELSISGTQLFSVAVKRATPAGEEVFTYAEPLPETSGWGPAERKTFNILWPADQLGPGDYLIAVTPFFGAQEPLQIHTRLK